MSTEIKVIQHPTTSGLVRYQQAGIAYEPTSSTTPSDMAILRAINGLRVKEAKDAALDAALIKSINTALLLLGQKNQWKEDNDQEKLVTELHRLIRQKYSYYTLEEVELIFRLGSRGELKLKPTDVVFLNIEQVSSWLRIFKNDTRAKAIASCRRIEETPTEQYDPKKDLKAAIEFLKQGQEVSPLTLTMLHAVYYDRFEQQGLILLSLSEKKQIYQEERQKELDKAKADTSNRGADKRFSFNLFREAVEKLAPLSDQNPFERRVKGNCRERVFKQALQELAWTETDIDTLEL